ncbi:MAG TPA: PAS domain S-box protein [Syntrophales bacterium]|nr:PAS domain S-box protein [Syntrophales bacterium]
MLETVLFISVILQVIAAILALRLIRITEVRAAWILIAAGLVLMAAARIIDILPFFSIEITPGMKLLNDWLDIYISIVMITGVSLIAPLFYAIRQSEKALRESEERYRTLVENLNVGVYRSTGDYKGRYLQVNPAMIKIFGYESIEEFMHIPIINVYRQPQDRKKFLSKIKEHGYVRNEELDLRKRDGIPIKASVTATAQFDGKGDIKWIDGVTEDITERKQAEDALRESEEKYRSLATTADSMYMVDRDCRYILMNEKHLSRFGLSLDEVKGRSYSEFHSEPANKEFVGTVEHVFESGKPVQHEYRSERDGHHFLRTFSPVKSPDGKTTIAVTVVSKDITDRKQVEEKLKESEQRLYNVIQGSPIPAFVIGNDHKVLYWNTALEELTRIKAEEVISTMGQWRAFYSIQRPCLADLLVDQSLDAISQWYSGKYIKSQLIEAAYEATDFFPELGDTGKWLRFTAAAIRNSRGELVGAIETLEDVTQRMRAEEALRNSELRLQSVIQSSPIPTFVIGKDHKVIYWNKAMEELSGITAEEVIGTTHYWRAFYSKERPVMADLIVDQALEAIPQWYFEKYVKSRLLDEAYEATDFFPELGDDGKWLRFTAAVIRDFKGNLVGAIETLEDITERKKAEAELIRVEKLESLGIFAGGIAHDFNNLLSVMLRNIFAVKLSFTDGQQEVFEEEIDIAEKAGLQAKELAHRLLTFAKGGEPVRKIGSISQLLMNSVDLSLSGSNIRCEFSLPSDLWPVEMDDVQIRQVVNNLVVNAREAMPEGGNIIIRAENIDVAAGSGLPLKEGKYVRWSVKDYGIGIPKEDLQKIYDPYFTTKPTGTARGMGLGLAICYSIIKKHDGFIAVESEPGVGSTFFVYLPASPQEGILKKDTTDISLTKGGKILVMDDEETVRSATGVVLNYLGYEVEYAKNGNEAITLYRTAREMEQPYSAVILDLNVADGMGGKEAMKEILAIDPYVRAVITCGYSDDPVISEFRKQGVCRLVDVPYDIEKMKEILDELLK